MLTEPNSQKYNDNIRSVSGRNEDQDIATTINRFRIRSKVKTENISVTKDIPELPKDKTNKRNYKVRY